MRMTPRAWKFPSMILASALLATGCSEMTSDENASPGMIARGTMSNSGESFATGANTGAMISATAFVLAKHEATERQRRIAEERAHAVYTRMVAENRRRETATQGPEKKQRKPAPEETHAAPKKSAQKPVKLPHYIAVDTVKDERTVPQAKKSVMIWDTQAERIVGNDVYDISTPPPPGSVARFETYSAQYVGAGN
jgi:hypothetical protein